MDKLGERNCYMISHALKSQGYDFEWVYAYIEEDLYIAEAEDIKAFIEWICNNRFPCTEDTLEEVFQTYKADKEVNNILNEN